MQGNEYQSLAWETAKAYYKEKAGGETFHRQQLLTMVMGLFGEAGQLAVALQQMMEGGEGIDFEKLADKLGDIQWFIAGSSTLMHKALEDLMGQNIGKLRERYGKRSMSPSSLTNK